MDISHSELRAVLDYDPESGLFRWRQRLAYRVRVGDVAGSNHGNGYIEIGVRGRAYFAHRLAWFWVNGTWPNGQIDHIDGDKSNNRIANLRIASHGENIHNTGPRKNNACGVKGVSFRRDIGKWHARIMANRKLHLLGNFDCIEDAKLAYDAAAKRLHGDFRRTDS